MNVIFIFSQRLRVTKLKKILFDFEHLKKRKQFKNSDNKPYLLGKKRNCHKYTVNRGVY